MTLSPNFLKMIIMNTFVFVWVYAGLRACLFLSLFTNLVYLFSDDCLPFESSDATQQICPMTLTFATVGTIVPLTHVLVGLGRQMVYSYTQGVVTEMAYVSVNIQMPCGDLEIQSLGGCASPLSGNRALLFYSPVDGLRPSSCPKHAFSVYGLNLFFNKQLLVFFVIENYTDFSDRGDKHRQWQKYFWPLLPVSISIYYLKCTCRY